MALWPSPKFLFKTKKPPNPSDYLGRTVVIEGKKVLITKIVGNLTKPQFYEINGEHLIGMLRFHAQMLKDDSITEEQFKAFEDMELKAEKMTAPSQPDAPLKEFKDEIQ
jgi:hypothetical protein